MNKDKTKTGLQTDFIQLSDSHLQMRGSDNPDFKKQFVKTFSDLIFSQSDEMQEKLSKIRPASLMNAVFRATEAGASFAKKEISFIPFEIFKKEKVNGADKKTATGEYEALVIFDINFQKQQILRLANCKKFYTAEVHDGVEIVSDLTTGNFTFEGKNDVTKPTIGYYACFISTENQVYDLFMTCSEIIERAKFSPQFKAENYKLTGKSIHYEKIVVRNIMKIIPKISNELKSVLAYDEFTDYIDVIHEAKPAQSLEKAKKELVEVKKELVEKPTKKATKKVEEADKKSESESEVKTFF